MDKPQKRRTALILTAAMVIVMIMGPGPGLRIVNPDITNPSDPLTLGGMPVIYIWGIFWFLIQVVIVVIAYFTVWNDQEEVSV